MNFRSFNKFNAVVNTASGNFLPLTGENTRLDLLSLVYLIFVWLMAMTYVITMLIGLVCYLPLLEAVRTSGAAVTACAEVFCLTSNLIYRRKYLRNFIRKTNSLLVESDVLRQCIRDTIAPHKKRLKVYAVMNMAAWVIWELLGLKRIGQTDQFTYTDFRLATYFPGAPFTKSGFVLGTLFRAIAGGFIMLKKIGIDVYINYYITLLTAEYRYLEKRLTAALNEKDETSVIDALKECVTYHYNTMKTGEILIDALSFNVGVIYFNCIFRFCFTACILMTFQSYLTTFLGATFSMGSLIQIYLLCSAIQDLREASTSITNEAFYEDWYRHGRGARSTFFIIGLANKMECRLNAFGIFDLAVPTVATILKHSYSACLLVMNV